MKFLRPIVAATVLILCAPVAAHAAQTVAAHCSAAPCHVRPALRFPSFVHRQARSGSYPRHLLPLFLLLIGAEALWIRFGLRRAYPWRETFATIGVVALQIVGRVAQPALLAVMVGIVWPHRMFTVALPSLIAVAAAFIGVEFAYYWGHRFAHRWRWLWATHSVHHSSEHMTFATALRLGINGIFAGEWIFYMPLVFLGFQPSIVFGLLGLNLAYQFFLHTELVPKLGPIEWIFNTPSHHRVHHASNKELLNRNFGGVLIVFDRLFGTLAVEDENVPLRYGLLGERRGLNPLWIAFGGWWIFLKSLVRRRSRALTS